MEHQDTTEPAEKHAEVVVMASLDDSKKSTKALKTAEPAEKRTKALKTAEPVEKHTKMVVQLGSLHDSKKHTKALKTIVGIKGIKSVSFNGNQLVIVCDGTDPVAMITLLKQNLGHANLLSVTSGDERIREEQENEISSGSNSLAEPAEKRTKALKTAEPVEKHSKAVVQLGLLDDSRKGTNALKTAVGIQGIKSVLLDGNQLIVVGTNVFAVVTMLRKNLGYAEFVSVTAVDERIREEQENKISSGSDSLAEPAEKHTKVVIQLHLLDDSRMPRKALTLAVGIKGIKSVSLDGNRLVVVCDGTDWIAMIAMLRKKLGYAKLVSFHL